MHKYLTAQLIAFMIYSHTTHCSNCFQPSPIAICPHCHFDRDKYLKEHARNHHLPLFTRLDKGYVIGRVLGEGGFAIVYAALCECGQFSVCGRGESGRLEFTQQRTIEKMIAHINELLMILAGFVGIVTHQLPLTSFWRQPKGIAVLAVLFLSFFMSWKYAEKVEKNSDAEEVKWSFAVSEEKTTGSRDGYCAYLAEYPQGEYFRQADIKCPQKKTDAEAKKAAQKAEADSLTAEKLRLETERLAQEKLIIEQRKQSETLSNALDKVKENPNNYQIHLYDLAQGDLYCSISSFEGDINHGITIKFNYRGGATARLDNFNEENKEVQGSYSVRSLNLLLAILGSSSIQITLRFNNDGTARGVWSNLGSSGAFDIIKR